jgi:hypothetical protein
MFPLMNFNERVVSCHAPSMLHMEIYCVDLHPPWTDAYNACNIILMYVAATDLPLQGSFHLLATFTPSLLATSFCY